MPSRDFVDKLKRSGLYEDFKRDCVKEAQRIEEELDGGNLKRKRKKAIRDDRRHRWVLNLCVSPFALEWSEPYRMGYTYSRASPLSEFDVKNFDFLIFNYASRRKTAIFGEAKGSVSNASRVVTEANERRAVVEDYRDTIGEKYLRVVDEDVRFEYVIGVQSQDYSTLCDEIVDRGGGMIPWCASMFDEKTLSLNLSRSIDDRIKSTMLHWDNDLNQALRRKLKSDNNSYSVFPQSHEVAKLRVLVEASKDRCVDIEELRERFKRYLFYLGDEDIEKIMNNVIERALNAQLARWIDSETLRITTIFRQRERIEGDIEKKWIDHSVNSVLEQEKAKAMAVLEEEYEIEADKQKILDEY